MKSSGCPRCAGRLKSQRDDHGGIESWECLDCGHVFNLQSMGEEWHNLCHFEPRQGLPTPAGDFMHRRAHKEGSGWCAQSTIGDYAKLTSETLPDLWDRIKDDSCIESWPVVGFRPVAWPAMPSAIVVCRVPDREFEIPWDYTGGRTVIVEPRREAVAKAMTALRCMWVPGSSSDLELRITREAVGEFVADVASAMSVSTVKASVGELNNATNILLSRLLMDGAQFIVIEDPLGSLLNPS